MTRDLHAPLRENVRLLGEILGETLRDQRGAAFYQRVEQIRQLAVAGRAGGDVDITGLRAHLRDLDDAELLGVARAFSHFLNLANLAEQQHRGRLWHQTGLGTGTQDQGEPLVAVIRRLQAAGHAPHDIMRCLADLHIELVLTAHPTEVARRTMIRKYDHMAALLDRLDHIPVQDSERRADAIQALRRTILSAWRTDEIRRHRPTPVDEARWGFATMEQSLWHAVPRFLRRLDRLCRDELGTSLSKETIPVRFASWMGGDRDGNPNVTVAVTREVLLLARWMGADLFLRDVEALVADFAMADASEELRHYSGDSPEPYRVVLRQLRHRLRETRDRISAHLAGDSQQLGGELLDTHSLLQTLLLVDRSLRACGMQALAEGQLQDTLWRARCFGLCLLPLDIRQEASRHTDVLDAITRYLGLGSYQAWSEQERKTFLLAELAGCRPLFDERFLGSKYCSDEIREVLDTFSLVAEVPLEARRSYVISMARAPSDILSVMLLQRECGVADPMPVVPLFETLDDLNGASSTMAELLALPDYRQLIAGGQQIMIGYSDSAKDAGFLTAAWAQYCAQESLAELFARQDIPLTLFHGRGGSVSRGGSPTRVAVMSQPPGSVNGRIRVTEQGEMIRVKYGSPDVAVSNLEQYLGAVLEATLAPPRGPETGWREEMDRLTRRSLAVYRSVVQENRALVPYLRQVTPEQELIRLALGSRPARRRSGDDAGIGSLRAIPWVFAWTQMRLMLPAWLGTGEALMEAGRTPDRAAAISTMIRDWPFFQGVIDMLEMVLAKADGKIAAYYEERLTDDAELRSLGAQLREALQKTRDVLAQITGRQDLLANNPVMKWSIEVRNPYTDPLHLLQAELMGRLRASREVSQVLESALMVTITGIAAGMRNTG